MCFLNILVRMCRIFHIKLANYGRRTELTINLIVNRTYINFLKPKIKYMRKICYLILSSHEHFLKIISFFHLRAKILH